MIILDPYRKIKRAAMFAGMFAAVAVVLTLVFWSVRKLQMTLWSQPVPAPAQVQKSGADKQKEMLEVINGANQGAKETSAAPNGEQGKKQQEMQDAISKTNSQTQPVSREESIKRAQDMLNEMNKANKK